MFWRAYRQKKRALYRTRLYAEKDEPSYKPGYVMRPIRAVKRRNFSLMVSHLSTPNVAIRLTTDATNSVGFSSLPPGNGRAALKCRYT